MLAVKHSIFIGICWLIQKKKEANFYVKSKEGEDPLAYCLSILTFRTFGHRFMSDPRNIEIYDQPMRRVISTIHRIQTCLEKTIYLKSSRSNTSKYPQAVSDLGFIS